LSNHILSFPASFVDASVGLQPSLPELHHDAGINSFLRFFSSPADTLPSYAKIQSLPSQ